MERKIIIHEFLSNFTRRQNLAWKLWRNLKQNCFCSLIQLTVKNVVSELFNEYAILTCWASVSCRSFNRSATPPTQLLVQPLLVPQSLARRRTLSLAFTLGPPTNALRLHWLRWRSFRFRLSFVNFADCRNRSSSGALALRAPATSVGLSCGPFSGCVQPPSATLLATNDPGRGQQRISLPIHNGWDF
jgi:hypothetical protein